MPCQRPGPRIRHPAGRIPPVPSNSCLATSPETYPPASSPTIQQYQNPIQNPYPFVPRPPQTPAAHLKPLYRNWRGGRIPRLISGFVGRVTSDRMLAFHGQSLPDPMRWRGESLKTTHDHFAQWERAVQEVFVRPGRPTSGARQMWLQSSLR